MRSRESDEVGKVLKKFDDIKEDIKRDMERAGRIRILSRPVNDGIRIS